MVTVTDKVCIACEGIEKCPSSDCLLPGMQEKAQKRASG